MQNPSLRRVIPGNPFPGRAEQWNRLVDSSEKMDELYQQIRTEDVRFDHLQTAIQIKLPASSRGYRMGEYVVLDGVLTDPSKGEGVFRGYPVVDSMESDWEETATPQWGHLAILAQDADRETIAYAYTTGTCIARLVKRYDYHDHADIDPLNGRDDNGEFSRPLVSHPSGSWQILWTDSVPDGANPDDTVPGWAILRFKGVWQRELKCQIPTGTELVPGTSMAVPVSWKGQDTLDPANTNMITVHHNWFDQQGNPLGSESKILAKWFPDELQWVVVAAEC